MPIARKNAVTALIVWTLVLGGLIAAVLGPGVARFTAPDHSIWRLLVAVIILPGFVVHFWLIWRSNRGRRLGELDERDEAVARKASEATLVVVAILVFSVSLALYEIHAEGGTVPAGWLYLLAYGTMAVVSMVHAAATLVLDLGGGADG